MIIFDVNVLIYAHREELPHHKRYLRWLENILKGHEAFGVSDIVFSSFLRITTHPRIFKRPSTFAEANMFVGQVRSNDKCVSVSSGVRHWDIFISLCQKLKARANLIPDVYLAAMVIELGDELVTSDKGFSRFPDLKWHHPLQTR